MNSAALVLPLVACIALVFASPTSAAGSDVVRDTTTVQAQLGATRDAARIPLLLELAELKRDEPAAALRLTDEALALLSAHPSAPREAEAHVVRSYALQAQGAYDAALAEARQAERLALGAHENDLIARANYGVALVEWRMADYPAALAKAEAARMLQAPRGNSVALVRTLNLLGGVHQGQGDLEHALENYLAALHMSEALGDELAAARSRNNVGLIYWELGRYPEAYVALRRALESLERLGPKAAVARAMSNVGLVLSDLDRPREAIPYLERALKLDLASGDLYGQAKDYSNLGFAHVQLEEPERALEFHQKALALRERIGDKDGRVRSLGALAGIRMRRGEVKAAIGLLEQGSALAAAINNRPDEASQLEALSDARAGIGDTAGAYVAYRRFHELQAALNDSTSRRQVAELETRYRTREHERELAALGAVAESRRKELRRLLVGSGLLAGCLVLLGVLYVLRLRAQRALAESEQRYRALFHSSVVPTFLIEDDGRRIADLNDAARALCGDVPAQGRSRLGELEPEWIRRALAKVFEAGDGDSVALDDCWSDPSGRIRWTEVRGSSVALGGRACRLVSVRDATDRHAEEEASQREEKMLSLGVLAGGIAHDFNNALTAVIGHVALARGSEPAEREEMLDLAQKAAVGAGRLTAQLLAFSRGGLPVRRSTNVGPLLSDTVALAGAGSHLRVDLEVPGDLWPAHVDGGQFSQVVSNLVINAQQAAAGGGRLRVRASNFAGDPIAGPAHGGQRHVRVDVSDDGAGIPENIRGRVFDPYFTTKPGGSGLGLTTAYAICRNHGGTLTFESREGQGTTFSAFFPAAVEPVVEMEPPRTSEPKGEGRILVLDDEPLVRSVLARILEKWGYTVVAVADGHDAVQSYLESRSRGTPFDLVIMDLTIPGGMGGHQAIAEILRHDPAVRAIVSSGYSDDPIMAHHHEAGFMAALAKPFQERELALAVHAVLKEHARSS
jgi:PAS domain S-box-containing protein